MTDMEMFQRLPDNFTDVKRIHNPQDFFRKGISNATKFNSKRAVNRQFGDRPEES